MTGGARVALPDESDELLTGDAGEHEIADDHIEGNGAGCALAGKQQASFGSRSTPA